MRETKTMSRALNVNAQEQHVRDMCAKHKTPITAIETLRSGGTRVVLMNAADAAKIGKAYGSKVLTGVVERAPSRLMHG